MNKFLLVPIMTIALLQSCSTAKYATAPHREYDTTLLTNSKTRAEVVSEVGQPLKSFPIENNKIIVLRDTYVLHKGVSDKATKALLSGVLALYTLGMSELVTSPLASESKGDKETFRFYYDDADTVYGVAKLIKVKKGDLVWIPLMSGQFWKAGLPCNDFSKAVLDQLRRYYIYNRKDVLAQKVITCINPDGTSGKDGKIITRV